MIFGFIEADSSSFCIQKTSISKCWNWSLCSSGSIWYKLYWDRHS